MLREMDVVFATDENYVKQTCVAMESILLVADAEDKYNFWIMTDREVERRNERYFVALEKKYRNCSVNYICMDGLFKKVYTPIKHITRPTYFRLLLPELLKVDRCIYLDSDIIVCQNIAELFTVSMEEFEIAGVIAPAYQRPEEAKIQYAEKINIPDMDTYINAGMLVMNLTLMRKNGFVEKAMQLTEIDFPASDQDIINKVSFGKIKKLPFKYNFQGTRVDEEEEFRSFFSEEEWSESQNNPCIIHYSTSMKPWEIFTVPKAEKWWKVCRQSELYDDFQKKYEKNFFYYGIVAKGALWKYEQYSREWFNELRKYKDIFLYGAGEYSSLAMENLRKKQIEVAGVLVSRMESNPQEFYGMRVTEYSEAVSKMAMILIAANENNSVEIKRNLLEYEHFNFFILNHKKTLTNERRR